jgi:hypothetical protein
VVIGDVPSDSQLYGIPASIVDFVGSQTAVEQPGY